MPNKANNDQFVDAVKPALESLLSDLQRTTEVLRRANDRSGNERITTTKTTTTTYANKKHGYDNEDDIEPIYQYQDQSKNNGTPRDGRDAKETDFSSKTSSRNELRSTQPNSQSISQLDSMLGNSQGDIDKHGIHTIPKGDCASCGKAIIGQVVIALGKMWHPEHYVCCHCGEEIGHQNFFERGGKAYCENDYHDLFSPRCAYCNGPIRDDGYAYCKSDFYRIYAPKCQGCKEPIKNKFITALNTHWHPECFTCQICHRPFDGVPNFFDHNGVPLCELHYHEKKGSLCHHCNKPISGRCVFAMGKKFHPEHFYCNYCNKELCRGTFKEANGRAFCHKCYERCNSL